MWVKQWHVSMKNGDLSMKNGDLPMKNGDLPMKNGDFPELCQFTMMVVTINVGKTMA